MWQRIVHFISYHNAIPITLGVLFLGAGTTFAMSPEVRGAAAEAVFKEEQRVVSIDNTYIVNKDLASYTPQVNITDVVEDETHYYVDYTLSTIALEDHVWQDVTQERQMKVAKDALGEYTDLGVYVTEQLRQLVDRELAQLQEVQEIERRQVSNKAVATAYSGLVGQFIDERTEELPGYTPVVEEPEGEPGEDPVAVAQRAQADSRAAREQDNDNSGTSSSSTSDSAAPVLTLLGANPARIAVGSTYSDLGVTITTAEGRSIDLTVQLSLDGEEVSHIDVDTSEPGEWTVGYQATYEDATGHAERRVVVYDPNTQDTSTTTPDTSGSQQDDSTQQNTTSTDDGTSTDDTDGGAATSTGDIATDDTTTNQESSESTTSTSQESGSTDDSTETQDTTATSTDQTASDQDSDDTATTTATSGGDTQQDGNTDTATSTQTTDENGDETPSDSSGSTTNSSSDDTQTLDTATTTATSTSSQE